MSPMPVYLAVRPRPGPACVLLAYLATAACDDAPSQRERACVALDDAWSVEAIGTPSSACPPWSARRDLRAEPRLITGVFHFNIQYVAGGLEGFLGDPNTGLDERGVEDLIIRVGFEPLLDIALGRPFFHTDIELQSYMIEVIAERHPDVLEKMRTLTDRGQVDFDSFHYSDQLYVAYPRRDMEVSLDLTEEVFARACLPRGRSIFAQEGQFARGQLPLAAERGYEVSMIPRNVIKYQLGDDFADTGVLFSAPDAPGHTAIAGGWSYHDPRGFFDLSWNFMDDGEIAFTKAELPPYFGGAYQVDPARIAEFEAELDARHAQGWVYATVAEAVAAMYARGYEPRPLPPLLDSTWQPANTGNVFRWMGGAGAFVSDERDSDVLAAIWRARRMVTYAEDVLAGHPEPRDAWRRGLTAAWRHTLLAQVSDSTGWNPFANEVDYSFEHAALGEGWARTVLTCAGEPIPVPEHRCEASGETTLDAIGVTVLSPARPIEVSVSQCAVRDANALYEIEIRTQPVIDVEPVGLDTPEGIAQRELFVTFERADDAFIGLWEALRDDISWIDLDDYVFDEIGVPLVEGVIGLGGYRWVIQDMTTGRLAALLSRVGAERASIRFADETVPRASPTVRRFYLLEHGSAATALRVARTLNGREGLAQLDGRSGWHGY